jgi:hypothetical protein
LVNIERKKMRAWLAALVRAVLAPVRVSYSAVRSSLLGNILPSRHSLTRGTSKLVNTRTSRDRGLSEARVTLLFCSSLVTTQGAPTIEHGSKTYLQPTVQGRCRSGNVFSGKEAWRATAPGQRLAFLERSGFSSR